jgi:hypothetical protein
MAGSMAAISTSLNISGKSSPTLNALGENAFFVITVNQ